jgi:phosphoribosylformylglycinamidine cyclo-ligase
MGDMKSKSYKDSGVDTLAADSWVERIAAAYSYSSTSELKAKVKAGVGAYAAVYELSTDRWIAASCDGVGTKLLWTLEGLGTLEDLAQDLVAMNVNDLICVGARPLLFLDYVAFSNGKFLEENNVLDQFLRGLNRACAQAQCLLVGGETAQMPDFYSPKHFDVSGFAVGDLAPEDWLQVEGLEEGARVWGWSSSGPHSNGFSWLRKLFDLHKDADFIRQHLMVPTRLYVKEFEALRRLLKAHSASKALQGAYHITGSGLLNLLRAQPSDRQIGFVLDQAWPLPLWAQELQKRSGSSDAELYSSFNMGMGLCVVIEAKTSQKLSPELRELGLQDLGYVDNKARVELKRSGQAALELS